MLLLYFDFSQYNFQRLKSTCHILARDTIQHILRDYAIARLSSACLSVCTSVRPTHGWFVQAVEDRIMKFSPSPSFVG